jgi:hypothetical protein
VFFLFFRNNKKLYATRIQTSAVPGLKESAAQEASNYPLFLVFASNSPSCYSGLLYSVKILSLKRRRRFFFLVNADRVKRKLLSLLIDNSTNKRKSWNSLIRYSYRLTQFEKRQSEKYDAMTNRILMDLVDLERVVNLIDNKSK